MIEIIFLLGYNFLYKEKISLEFQKMLDYRLSIAPMVGHTNRYFRLTMRQLTKKTLLFTEMITSGSILRGESEKILSFSREENPVIFQIAGCNPQDLAYCAKMVEDYGYAGINLNIGCPSAKVQKGGFGVCLMKNPELVAEMIFSIKKSVSLPISVKTRIGIDDLDSLEFLENFIQKCAFAGCEVFFLHARKALLNYNPRKNRTVPPIHYDRVLEIQKLFPNLTFIINGEITSLEQAKQMLKKFSGVMIGRKAIQNPLLFEKADTLFFPPAEEIKISLLELITKFLETANFHLEKKHHLMRSCRHLFSFFHSFPNAKYWRSFLHEQLVMHPFEPLKIKENLEKNWEFMP